MTFDEFFAEVRERKIEVEFKRAPPLVHEALSNEALFHLPLLAMTILMIATSRSRPQVEHLGQLVGECFERTFIGFQGSAQILGWSASLRVRTVQALTFLESTGLVNISGPGKIIAASELGRSVIAKARKGGTDLAFTLSVVARAHRNINAEKQRFLG
jgi:hypothetical protein